MKFLMILLLMVLLLVEQCNCNHYNAHSTITNNIFSSTDVPKSNTYNSKEYMNHNDPYIDKKYIKLFFNGGDNSMGYRLVPDAAIGKDREIFHLAIDLKWLWCTIIDGSTWLNLLSKIGSKIKSITTTKDVDKRESRFREIVTDILIGIKVFNRASTLKLFLGDLKQIEKMSTMNAKFVVVYVEGGDSKVPTRESIEYRKALADISLGNILNEQFIFSATSTQIPAMQKLVKKLNSGKECPFFAVLCPSSVVSDEGIESISGKHIEDLELLATLRLPINEIKPNKISRFLVRTLEVFDGKLSSLKTYSEEMHESAKKRNDTKSENFAKADSLRRLALSKSLPTEPSIIDRNTITITIRPQQGERLHHIRRFRLSDTFQIVHTWADSCGVQNNHELVITDPATQNEENLKLNDIKVHFNILSIINHIILYQFYKDKTIMEMFPKRPKSILISSMDKETLEASSTSLQSKSVRIKT